MSAASGFWRRLTQTTVERLNLDLVHIQTRYAKALHGLVRPHTHWLDIGCGRQLVPPWALAEEEVQQIVRTPQRIVGVDFDHAILDHPHLHDRAIASGYQLPFAANSFDLVSANMVLEHLEQPEVFFAEVQRVLKPGGRFAFATPNQGSLLIWIASFVPDAPKKKLIWFVERRHADDVFPTHYRANCLEDVQQLAVRSGLAIHQLHYVNSIATFGRLGPIGFIESVLMGYLPNDRRTNILAVLEKPRI